MFKKSIIALCAAIALFASFAGGTTVNACEESAASAFARPRC